MGLLSIGIVLAVTLAAHGHASATEKFAVRTVHAPGEAGNRYLACLARREHPRWKKFHGLGRLLDARVFEKVAERNTQAGPTWSVLTILRARDEAAAKRLAKASRCERLRGVSLIRSEVMVATPASDHPAPADRARPADLAFLIEFIAVNETADALAEYRETMRTSIGPAMGRLVSENGHHSSLFLERPDGRPRLDGPGWNQIHVRGYYADPGPTHPRMTAYMEEANPQRGGFAEVFRRLDAIRTKPRDDVAREITGLAIGVR